MKKIAVLTSGPSLSEYFDQIRAGDYDLTIGINEASWKFPVDIAACLDQRTFDLWPFKFYPKQALTSRAIRRPPGVELIPLPELKNAEGESCRYTFPLALKGADELAAGGQADIYGFDASLSTVGNHSLNRWKIELEWVRLVWDRPWRVFGRAPAALLEWLAGDTAEPWESIQ